MRVSAGLPTGMEGLTYPIPFSDPENVIRIAQAAEKFGYGPGYLDEFPERIRRVTREEVNAAIKAHLHPEKLNLGREEVMMMTFGPGIHHCIGHLLARMQLGEFFPAFFKRFPDVKMLDDQLRFMPGVSFRGLEHLYIRPGK